MLFPKTVSPALSITLLSVVLCVEWEPSGLSPVFLGMPIVVIFIKATFLIQHSSKSTLGPPVIIPCNYV